MKKQHLVSIWFDLPDNRHYAYTGLVTGKMFNNKLVISIDKLFKSAFGFELPAHTKITF